MSVCTVLSMCVPDHGCDCRGHSPLPVDLRAELRQFHHLPNMELPLVLAAAKLVMLSP
jgi:hypothetical protein